MMSSIFSINRILKSFDSKYNILRRSLNNSDAWQVFDTNTESDREIFMIKET